MHEAHFTQVLAHDLGGHGHVSPRISKRCRIFTPSSCDVHGLGRVTLKPSHALFQVREVGSQRNVVMPRDQISVQKPCLNGGRSHEGHRVGRDTTQGRLLATSFPSTMMMYLNCMRSRISMLDVFICSRREMLVPTNRSVLDVLRCHCVRRGDRGRFSAPRHCTSTEKATLTRGERAPPQRSMSCKRALIVGSQLFPVDAPRHTAMLLRLEKGKAIS